MIPIWVASKYVHYVKSFKKNRGIFVRACRGTRHKIILTQHAYNPHLGYYSNAIVWNKMKRVKGKKEKYDAIKELVKLAKLLSFGAQSLFGLSRVWSVVSSVWHTSSSLAHIYIWIHSA